MKKTKLSFEESLRRLAEIVRHLESGDLALDTSLALFEEGTGLIKNCTAILDDAEQKVTILRTSSGGEVYEEPFAEGTEV